MRRISVFFVALAAVVFISACGMQWKYKGQIYNSYEEVEPIIKNDLETAVAGITPTTNSIGGTLNYYRFSEQTVFQISKEATIKKGVSGAENLVIDDIRHALKQNDLIAKYTDMGLNKLQLFGHVNHIVLQGIDPPSMGNVDYMIWPERIGSLTQWFIRSKNSSRKFRLVGQTTAKDLTVGLKAWLDEVEKWARVAKVQ